MELICTSCYGLAEYAFVPERTSGQNLDIPAVGMYMIGTDSRYVNDRRRSHGSEDVPLPPPVPGHPVRDTAFPVKWAYHLRDLIPGAREVVEIDGAKLFFPEERPEDLVPHLGRLWGR
jgi:hypothetical protein